MTCEPLSDSVRHIEEIPNELKDTKRHWPILRYISDTEHIAMR